MNEKIIHFVKNNIIKTKKTQNQNQKKTSNKWRNEEIMINEERTQ